MHFLTNRVDRGLTRRCILLKVSFICILGKTVLLPTSKSCLLYMPGFGVAYTQRRFRCRLLLT